MSKTCGDCAWWDADNDKESGDCFAPAPMSFWDAWDRQTMNADSDATACPCFKARVSDCQYCDGNGFVYPLVDGKVGQRQPCPACHGNNAASRGKEES